MIEFLARVVDSSEYAARVFEVAAHSLFQVLEDEGVLDGTLKPLCQMRSANKKHGNVGDVEVIRGKTGLSVLEAWDAKYGKSYLRDELEELGDKLADHDETKLAGFVTSGKPDLRKEVRDRIVELEDLYSVTIQVLSFHEWAKQQLERSNDPSVACLDWLTAFAESLCLKRRIRAPIDEPAEAWVRHLCEYAEARLKQKPRGRSR